MVPISRIDPRSGDGADSVAGGMASAGGAGSAGGGVEGGTFCATAPDAIRVAAKPMINFMTFLPKTPCRQSVRVTGTFHEFGGNAAARPDCEMLQPSSCFCRSGSTFSISRRPPS